MDVNFEYNSRMRSKTDEHKIGHYYDDEQIKYLYCYTCLVIVLDRSEKARGKFEEVKKCWELPGCKQFVDGVLGKTLNKKFLPTALRLAGLNPKEDRTMKLKDSKAIMLGVRRLISLFIFAEKIRLFFNRRKCRDYKKLERAVQDFIKIGFNRESDIVKGEDKIKVKSSTALKETAYLWSLNEIKKLDIESYGNIAKLPAIKKKKNIYTFEQLLNKKVPRLTYEQLAKEYKNNGHRLKDEEAIARNANDWCQGRIFYSGIEEYSKSKENIYGTDSSNISHKIKECDEALGYPRGK